MLRALLHVIPRPLSPSRFDADVDPFLTDDTGWRFD